MLSAGGNAGDRRARRDADQPPVGVELIEQGMEVVLGGPATVVEDQRALRLAGGLADQAV
jgi:hypothetical protein